MPDHAIVADRQGSGSSIPAWMRFPVFIFAVALVVVGLFALIAKNPVALGFLIPAFLVCSLVALVNYAARKFNPARIPR